MSSIVEKFENSGLTTMAETILLVRVLPIRLFGVLRLTIFIFSLWFCLALYGFSVASFPVFRTFVCCVVAIAPHAGLTCVLHGLESYSAAWFRAEFSCARSGGSNSLWFRAHMQADYMSSGPDQYNHKIITNK